jgi:hypothetical protein
MGCPSRFREISNSIKNGRQKVTFSKSSDFLIFKRRHLKKGKALEKVSLFWRSFSL